ncbi:hypothetical protein Q8F55_000850 [Vanrija albida]|uniref:UBA domain-containing protein n=1 Tax=Vanrija albida TaxID=181172 RepID=A0ABR3QFH5_9TREE
MSSQHAAPADLVSKLKDLGISERSAKFALARNNNNVEQAAEYVFSGRADKDEVSSSPDTKEPYTSSPVMMRPSSLDSLLHLPPRFPLLQGSGSSPGLTAAFTGVPPGVVWRHKRRTADVADAGEVANSTPESSDSGHQNDSVDVECASHSGGVEEDVSETEPVPELDQPAAPGAGREDSILTQDSVVSLSIVIPDERDLEQQSNDIIMAALGRTVSNSGSPLPSPGLPPKRHSITSKPTAGALAALGMRAAAIAGPTVTPPTPAVEDPPSGPNAGANPASKTLLQPSRPLGRTSSTKTSSTGRSRSPSPFFRARRSREERRARDKSPEVQALRKDSIGAESDAESTSGGPRKFRPAVSAYESPDESGNEGLTEDEHDDSEPEHHHYHDDDDDDSEWDEDNFFDDETKGNTEANAFYEDDSIIAKDDGSTEQKEFNRENFDVYGEEVEHDVLGEGPNVVVPEEPIFAQPSHLQPAKVRKSLKSGLDLVTSRPTYARDRCTITITQGDPDAALDESGKRMRRYVVLSDLSEESRYAVEWAIGTVARDGDEVFLISVMENEDKVDPKNWSGKDQALKIKVQKERQTTALLLVRQVTGLLTRTRLNITVTCQALHAKNARHMLLDLIDFLEPTLVIVGSRGLGQLKGILLGSTSHYLVQKSSVPVMVARRRLHRPLRSTNPEELRHSPRVSLASANIEKVASSKAEDDIVDAADEEEKAESVDPERHEAVAS